MKTLKTVDFLIIFLLGALSAVGQNLSIGPKINIGTAYLNSKNLKESFNACALEDNGILSWDSKSSMEITYGFGAVIDHTFTDQFFVFTELTYNFQKTKFKIDQEENTIDGMGNGAIVVTQSEAAIKAGNFSIPVLARYQFSEKGYFVYYIWGDRNRR